MLAKLKRSAEGARVPHHKGTAELATEKMPLPEKIVLPMQQHIGAPCTPAVKKGDTVYVGTVVGTAGGFVSADIHSGVSGKVKKIDEVLQFTGQTCQAIIIESDGLQTPYEGLKAPEVTDFDSFINAVRDSGVVGLGAKRVRFPEKLPGIPSGSQNRHRGGNGGKQVRFDRLSAGAENGARGNPDERVSVPKPQRFQPGADGRKALLYR